MTRLFLLLAMLLAASCTPIPPKEEDGARCGLLEGPECRQSVTGLLPGDETEIGKLAKHCPAPRYCGPIGYVDCGAAVDGPAYYFEKRSGKVVGRCGGICWADADGKCDSTCPPPEWTCKR